MTPPEAADSGPVKLPGNPFVVDSPEKLTPQQIVDLFVKEYTRLETVKQRRHTFIWGSRGSGKSMMLRYLEPECQKVVTQATRLFDPAAIAGSIKEAKDVGSLGDDPLGWFQRVLYAENRKVCTFLRDKCLKGGRASYKGATSGYHDFLLPFLKL